MGYAYKYYVSLIYGGIKKGVHGRSHTTRPSGVKRKMNGGCYDNLVHEGKYIFRLGADSPDAQ